MNQVFNANDDVINADSDAGLKVSLEAGLKAGLEADFNLNNTKILKKLA